MNSERLKEFRQAASELLIVAKDATFQLMDAVMTTRNASSLHNLRSVHYSIVNGQASMKHYRTADQTRKN